MRTLATFCVVLTYIFFLLFKDCTRELWPTDNEILHGKMLCVVTIISL